jgi:hypothetical protein
MDVGMSRPFRARSPDLRDALLRPTLALPELLDEHERGRTKKVEAMMEALLDRIPWAHNTRLSYNGSRERSWTDGPTDRGSADRLTSS